MVSVILDPSLDYPGPEGFFSPHQAYPEYPFKHLATKTNPVYAAVRRCLAEAGLDRANFGKSSWNPLGQYIRPGQKVFVLCNFVQHQLGSSREAFHAKCTHGSVIRAVIDYVLMALGHHGTVRFGNAPLQSCEWEKVIEQTGAQRVLEFYQNHAGRQAKVLLNDLRQHIIHRSLMGTVETRFHGEDMAMCVPVDLGGESLLDQFYRLGPEPKFRVLDYDHRRTAGCHARGRHVYLINRHILDSDVVISVPKLKTHEKVGITCGVKGCVGAVGHKDCLAHHRLGPPREGGDEYSNELAFLRPLSRLHDVVYTTPTGMVQGGLHLLNQLGRTVVRRFTRALSGSWPGNDTCWRMAVDLAKILEHADAKGGIHQQPHRTHLMVTDGIVAGEGDGPLSPQPVKLGYLSFADDVPMGDYINCLSMGFDPSRLPMVREAVKLSPQEPVDLPEKRSVIFNGELMEVARLRGKMTIKFKPAREWRQWL